MGSQSNLSDAPALGVPVRPCFGAPVPWFLLFIVEEIALFSLLLLLERANAFRFGFPFFLKFILSQVITLLP